MNIKKQAIIDAENKAKQAALQAEKKRIYLEKYSAVIKEKAAYLAASKATATTTLSGLQYVVLQKGSGRGTNVLVKKEGKWWMAHEHLSTL